MPDHDHAATDGPPTGRPAGDERSGPILPPATLGFIGGSPHDASLVAAAQQMGYRTVLLSPDHGSRAARIADVHIVATTDDETALDELARTCAAITSATVGVDGGALTRMAQTTLMRPSPAVLQVCADRIAEKRFLDDIGVTVAEWRAIESADDLEPARGFAYPAILSPARRRDDETSPVRVQFFDDLDGAWQAMGGEACLLERRVMLSRELSMVVVRATDGRTATYPVAQQTHTGTNIDIVHVPAVLPEGGHEQAAELCTYIADELELVGILCVGLVVAGRDVLVSELAPHPHDAGQYTLDACTTSQFEQQIRVVCGLGPADTTLQVKGVATATLTGELWATGEPDWSAVLAEPAAHLHLQSDGASSVHGVRGHLAVTTASALGAASLAKRLRSRAKR